MVYILNLNFKKLKRKEIHNHEKGIISSINFIYFTF